ncbi:MAG: TIGR00266 family protein [Bdellovibrionaceae bacterium]|nr:TIGR00266 family protein [Pseudobdellovibrionaceae bacterium]
MEVIEKGRSSFTHLAVTLKPGEKIISESGAMASMDKGIDIHTELKGGLLSALARKIFGGESAFLNTYFNKGTIPQTLVISKITPGDIYRHELNNEGIYLQPGSFVCCSPSVRLQVKWAGFRFLFGGEGIFRLYASGVGTIWIGVYGTLVEKEVHGEFIVDTGHLVAYPPTVRYKIQLSGGLISSFTSGEGLVGRLEGKGKVLLQTRSLGGLVSWLNPRLI